MNIHRQILPWLLVLSGLVVFAEDVPDRFVECVRSHEGTQYINTGIEPKSGTKVELDFAFLDNPSTPEHVAGTMNASSQIIRPVGNYYGVRGYAGTSGGGGRFTGMVGFKGKMVRYNTVTTFVSGGSTYVQDGVQIADPEDAYHSYFGTLSIPDCTGYPLYLFAENEKGAAAGFAKIALYGAKIWLKESGEWVLKRDYRPCLKNKRAGLYEAVSKTIVYSASSDDFTPNPHIVYPETVGGLTPGQQIIDAMRKARTNDTVLFTSGTYAFADDEYMSEAGTLKDKERVYCNVSGITFMGEDTSSRKTWTEGAEPVIINVNGGRFVRNHGAMGFRMTGLTVTGGDVRSTWSDPGSALTLYYGEAVISNCVFRGNSAWRGGACGGSTYQGVRYGYYYDCLFKDNRSRVDTNQSSGGAIYAAREAKDCDFIGNHAQVSGAIEKISLVERCTFKRNGGFHSSAYGCAVMRVNTEDVTDIIFRDCLIEANTNYNHSVGGVLRFEGQSRTNAIDRGLGLYVSNCTFRANHVISANGFPRGTAVSSYVNVGSDALYPGTASKYTAEQRARDLHDFLVCEDCVFEGNTGSQGCFSGAAAGITARRCTFRDNFTPDAYGYVWGDSVEYSELTDCDLSGGGEISGCSLTRCSIHDITNGSRYVFCRGGTCYMTNCLVSGCRPRGSIFYEAEKSMAVNCTFVRNEWKSGSYFYDCSDNATNVNCVYWGNVANGQECAVSAYNDKGKKTIRFLNCALGPGRQEGLLYDAACFDFTNPRFNAGLSSAHPYYEPRSNSPLKNSGDNALVGFRAADVDLGGRSRLNGPLDVGCYESWMKGEGLVYTISW